MIKIFRGVEDTPITWKTLGLFLQKKARGVSKEICPGISRNALGIRWGRAWGLLTFLKNHAPWHVAHVSFGPRAVFKMFGENVTGKLTGLPHDSRHRWTSGRNCSRERLRWVCYKRRYAAIQDVRHGRKSSKIPLKKGAKCISVETLWWSMDYGFIPQTCWLAGMYISSCL